MFARQTQKLGILALSLALAAGAGCGSDSDSTTDPANDVVQDTSKKDAQSNDQADPDWAADTMEPDSETPFVPVEPHVEEADPYTIVWLAGTPYEMGKQHGELLHDVVGDAMDFVKADPMMSKIPQMAEAMGIIKLAKENSYDDLLEECQGLVDATSDVGFSMEYCLALNFGDVMLEFIEVGMPGQEFPAPGCSGVIARDDATPDGILRHTRNLDWGSMDISIIHQHPVIFVRQPEGGIPHVYVGFPLNLSPYTGMNMAGISVGSHEAEPLSKAQLSKKGRSHVQMVGQILKNSKSLVEAEAFLRSQQHMSTEMLVVADGPNNDGAVFEMTGQAMEARRLENNVVWATNHFTHPDMTALHQPPGTGSFMRFQRFSQLVPPDGKDSIWGELDQAGLARVMRDRVDSSTGELISDEELEAMDWDNDIGIGSNGPMHFVVFEPENHLFWVAAGKLPIHRQPYRCFSLAQLLGIDGKECPGDIAPEND